MNEQPSKQQFEQATPTPPPQAAPPPAKTRAPARRRLILVAVLLAAVGAALFYGWRWWTVGRFMVSTDDAYVKADVTIISAKIAGYIADAPVADNQVVKAGDVLVQIDPGDYKIALAAAQRRLDTQDATIARVHSQIAAQESVIAQAVAQRDATQADRARAAADYQRAATLAAQSFATQQRLDQARADKTRTSAASTGAQAGIDAAQAQLAVLKAQETEATRQRAELQTAVDRAQRDLDFATVRAPFDGVVGNRAAQLGAFVQPGARLMALVPLQSAYVEANFKETQLAAIKPGEKALVKVDALGDKPIEAVVESIAPASGAQYSLLPPENATGNFTKIVQRVPVRIRLPAEALASGALRPGLSTVVDIDTRTAKTGDDAHK
ncbi:MAG: HlyD family secretion protein [Hyphomicrobiales bacterium]|nr:HlyD family secretion protein [Hyphomicrobiales bacterium]